MKIKLPFTALLSLIVSVCWSQLVVVKPAAGLNSAHITHGSDYSSYSDKRGFDVGVSAAIGRRFYVEPGLFYINKNSGFILDDRAFGGPRFTGTYKLTGFQIPLAFGYQIIRPKMPKEIFGVRVFTGGSVFFLRKTDLTYEFNKTQWGLFGGLGVDVAWFFFDAKYEWSLTDLQSQPPSQLGRSRALFLNLGIRIPVAK